MVEYWALLTTLTSYHLPRWSYLFAHLQRSSICHQLPSWCTPFKVLRAFQSRCPSLLTFHLAPSWYLTVSLYPAAHAIGSELTFSSPLFSHRSIYQILCLILDLSVLSTALIPTGTTYCKLPPFLDKGTYSKSSLTCFYFSTFASWDSILHFLTNLKVVFRVMQLPM